MANSSPTRESHSSRGFWSLIATQFQGGFSDNALKNLVVFLIIARGLSQQQRDQMIFWVGALFAAPFILFSMTGGYLADRFSKRSVTIGTKVMEVCVALFATTGLLAENIPLLLSAVFLMSVQSALFGPSKYGLLPELLPQKRISWGNGVLELGTFLAIIFGTVTGGILAEQLAGRQVWSGALLVTLAGVGLLTSLGISHVPPADPAKKFRANFLGDLFSQIGAMRGDRVLWLAVVGNTYFWFLGFLLQLTIVVYGHDVLHASETEIGYLLATIALGIGIGSLLAGYLSGNKIEYGLIPLGAVGMSVTGALLGRGDLSFFSVAVHLAVLGFFGGFFAVPINALIQHRPAEDKKGGVIAAANLLSFVGVFLAAGAYYAMSAGLHLSPPRIFLVSAGLTLAGTLYALWLLPDALLRLVLWFATRLVYRMRIEGRDNIPERGGALFVSNHVSFMDALLLIASTDRPIRFLMFKDIYEHPAIYPFAKVMRAIPISSQQRPREMILSLRAATEAIRSGEVVCIFAEGQITRIGQMLPFRRGFERIMKDVDAPIVPVCLDGVWGSIFSFEKQRFLWKFPREIPYRVTVCYGQPMPASSKADEVRLAVQELQSEAFAHRRSKLLPLNRAWLRSARRHRRRLAMADGRTPKVRFGQALVKTIFLARRLRTSWAGQEMVGLLLPPSAGGALVNYAALLLGKTPVNLNYTASTETLAACAKQCGIETVVTSRAFLEHLKVEVPGKQILLEDLAENPRVTEKLAALALSFLPAGMLERLVGRPRPATLDDLATVIFSSGSTGDPKGVMLTHYNVAANVEQLDQVFVLDKHDRLLGILPFFHSFGFTATLALPAVLGIGVVYHPSPIDARAIAALVGKYALTFLMATPTFLQAYVRRCAPEDFGSLRYVIAGAEKLPERVSQAFEDHFGLRPFEGYGCTECAPVVAVNTGDFRSAGFRQVGAKRGTIGHPLPGVTAKIVDLETNRPLPPGHAGLLLVRGPNVMKGYLGKPEKTAEVLRDGWYVTGDIAAMDEDGFLTITDRLSRFSKIGGEMVPHVKVEEKLHELAGATDQAFVVTGVPDAKKGERLVVLHSLADEALKDLLEKLPQAGLPNLWVPRGNQFFRVESFPLLGTGKLDLRKAREAAMEFSGDA